MMSISLAAAVTAMWLVSLPEDHQLHLPRMEPTRAMAAEAQPTQERFEQERNAEIDASIAAVAARRVQERFERERNAEIDASIAAVAARRVQERFEQERNAEIDASIATNLTPWVVSIANLQGGSFAAGDGPAWQP